MDAHGNKLPDQLQQQGESRPGFPNRTVHAKPLNRSLLPLSQLQARLRNLNVKNVKPEHA